MGIGKPFSARVQLEDVRILVLAPARMPVGYVSMIWRRADLIVFSGAVNFAGAVSGRRDGNEAPTFTISTSSIAPSSSFIFSRTLVKEEVCEEPLPVYGITKVAI